jgi:hypothetical protein
MAATTTSKATPSQNELGRRGVLAHAEHLKSFSEALTKAVDTYLVGHAVSESVTDWRDDFANNIAEASKEFHRSLASSSRKVADIYFGEDEPNTATKTTSTKKGGGTTSAES